MGYLLPIQPIQSQQYADRMNMDSYNFTKIDRVEKVNFYDDLWSRDFSGEQNHLYLDDEDEEVRVAIASTPPPYNGFIYPNPANLSPNIAQIVGKGLVINRYV